MKKINLKDYYAHISVDTYIGIPDEVFNIFEEHRKAEGTSASSVKDAIRRGLCSLEKYLKNNL